MKPLQKSSQLPTFALERLAMCTHSTTIGVITRIPFDKVKSRRFLEYWMVAYTGDVENSPLPDLRLPRNLPKLLAEHLPRTERVLRWWRRAWALGARLASAGRVGQSSWVWSNFLAPSVEVVAVSLLVIRDYGMKTLLQQWAFLLGCWVLHPCYAVSLSRHTCR